MILRHPQWRVHVEWHGDRQMHAMWIVGTKADENNGSEYVYRLEPGPVAQSRHGVRAEPTIWCDDRTLLQAIVDEAYRNGIRPSAEVADSDAQRKHLNDMRAIVGKQLGVELK